MLHCIEVRDGIYRVGNGSELHSAHAIRLEAVREAIRWIRSTPKWMRDPRHGLQRCAPNVAHGTPGKLPA